MQMPVRAKAATQHQLYQNKQPMTNGGGQNWGTLEQHCLTWVLSEAMHDVGIQCLWCKAIEGWAGCIVLLCSVPGGKACSSL